MQTVELSDQHDLDKAEGAERHGVVTWDMDMDTGQLQYRVDNSVRAPVCVFVCRRMKTNKKGSRPALKPENGVDSASAKSVSDGDAQSVRSVRSAPSPRSNRCPSNQQTELCTVHQYDVNVIP